LFGWRDGVIQHILDEFTIMVFDWMDVIIPIFYLVGGMKDERDENYYLIIFEVLLKIY
jgi:hypothetical protein